MGLVVDPVIETITTLQFEDGLRMGVLLGGCWALRAAAPSLGSIPNPLGVWVGLGGTQWGGVIVIGTLLSDRIPILLSSAH